MRESVIPARFLDLPDGLPQIKPVKITNQLLSASERMKRVYDKRKNENPEEYKKILEIKRQNAKEWRTKKKNTMTEEELAISREKARLRAVEYRKRKKEKEAARETTSSSGRSRSRPTTKTKVSYYFIYSNFTILFWT